MYTKATSLPNLYIRKHNTSGTLLVFLRHPWPYRTGSQRYSPKFAYWAFSEVRYLQANA